MYRAIIPAELEYVFPGLQYKYVRRYRTRAARRVPVVTRCAFCDAQLVKGGEGRRSYLELYHAALPQYTLRKYRRRTCGAYNI